VLSHLQFHQLKSRLHVFDLPCLLVPDSSRLTAPRYIAVYLEDLPFSYHAFAKGLHFAKDFSARFILCYDLQLKLQIESVFAELKWQGVASEAKQFRDQDIQAFVDILRKNQVDLLVLSFLSPWLKASLELLPCPVLLLHPVAHI